MNQKLLKVILLPSVFAMALAGCGETPVEQKSEEIKSETPSVEPSVEPVSEEEVSEVEEESSSEVVEENPFFRVTLGRNIYVEGEELDVIEVETYSKAIKAYKPNTNYTIVMPSECPNGLAHATISAGKNTDEIEFYYYKDAETAANNYKINVPDNAADYFKESAYINNGKLKFNVLEQNGKIYAARSTEYSMGGLDNELSRDQTWNTSIQNTWTASGCVAATLDPTKLTVPHYVEKDEISSVEKVYTCDTYQPEMTGATGTVTSASSMLGYEMITDANGYICYLGAIKWGEIDSIDVSSEEGGYWSYYKNYRENPALIFADDYDPVTNPLAYEKVLPEGGIWVIGYNNNGGSALGPIDQVYKLISGQDAAISTVRNAFTLSWADENVESTMQAARVFYESKTRKVFVYKEADTYQKYAYYYSLALKSQNTEQLALRDTLYNAIIKQKLPEVQAEKIILEYYEAQTTVLLEQWAAMFE